MTAALIIDSTVGACTRDPDRWMTATDDATKAVCRACPRRWLCARDACETPGAEGMWAGIVVPETGRGRTFALRQLRSLAERGGYPVRSPRRRTTPEAEAKGLGSTGHVEAMTCGESTAEG